VLLLRRLDIPARYAVGYYVHEASGRKFVVRQRDAHAWCLVWDKDRNVWEDFDTTPASWMEAEAKRAWSLQWLSDAWSRVGFEIAKIRWGQSRLRHYSCSPSCRDWLCCFTRLFSCRRRRRAKRRGRRDDFVGRRSGPEFYLLEKKPLNARAARRQ
jgi:hypothetical protein